jgi:hypothetical protein
MPYRNGIIPNPDLFFTRIASGKNNGGHEKTASISKPVMFHWFAIECKMNSGDLF